MKIWKSISIVCILLQPYLIFSASSPISSLISRDTLYSWANEGLNLRASVHNESEIIGSIPYGGAMVLLQKDGGIKRVQLYKGSDNYTLVNGIALKCIDYFQEGQWAKVQYGSLTGYVFSGYTSRFRPVLDDHNILNCLKQNVRQIAENEIYDPNSDCTHKYLHFENGISVVGEFSNYSSLTYIIPNMSLEESILLTRNRIDAKMKERSLESIGCINEKTGDKDSGCITFRISNDVNWTMQITWTYWAVIINEMTYC